jgi:hypothetical protein
MDNCTIFDGCEARRPNACFLNTFSVVATTVSVRLNRTQINTQQSVLDVAARPESRKRKYVDQHIYTHTYIVMKRHTWSPKKEEWTPKCRMQSYIATCRNDAEWRVNARKDERV